MSVLGKALRGGLVVGSILALSACGSSSSSSSSAAGGGSTSGGSKTIDIYSSLPLQGASTAQTIPLVNGIKLALSQANNKAGQFTVNYQSLDDSTAAAGEWDPTQTAANARKAATDPKAVYYIGEFNSGASEVSIPILNQAGIPQVSPANTYVGLTTNEPGQRARASRRSTTRPGSARTCESCRSTRSRPQPTCSRSRTTGCTQGRGRQRQGGVRRRSREAARAREGRLRRSTSSATPESIRRLRTSAPTRRRSSRRARTASSSPGIVSNGGVQITKDVHAALPTAKILGPDGMCTSSWTNAKQGGVPARHRSVHPVHGRDAGSERVSGRQAVPRRLQGQVRRWRLPTRMRSTATRRCKLGLQTIAKLGANGDNKADVLKALFATKDRHRCWAPTRSTPTGTRR